MPDTTITALPASAALTGTETLPADQGAATVKVTVAALSAHAVASIPQPATPGAAAPLAAADKVVVNQGGVNKLTTVHDFGRYAWNNAPVADQAVAGQDPTLAECDAALTTLALDKTVNRFFFIRDTTGANPKLYEILWRQALGKFYSVPLKEVT